MLTRREHGTQYPLQPDARRHWRFLSGRILTYARSDVPISMLLLFCQQTRGDRAKHGGQLGEFAILGLA